LVVAVVSTG